MKKSRTPEPPVYKWIRRWLSLETFWRRIYYKVDLDERQSLKIKLIMQSYSRSIVVFFDYNTTPGAHFSPTLLLPLSAQAKKGIIGDTTLWSMQQMATPPPPPSPPCFLGNLAVTWSVARCAAPFNQWQQFERLKSCHWEDLSLPPCDCYSVIS